MTPPSSLASHINGCWLGKSVGGTLGLPAEGKMERLHFTFYDPIPTSAPPNDDLELQLVWLHLLENTHEPLSKDHFAQAWLNHIHYMWDEYGRCRWNLRRGVPAASAGTFENHFHAGMGSPIRSEIWACLFPGDPDSAAHYAAMDASLDHGLEGIVGEVLFASMQSMVLSGTPLPKAIDQALDYIPEDSETAKTILFVRTCHRSGIEEWDCWNQLLAQHGNENFTHAPLNVALTIWALLYGELDFEKSILLATNGGYDTDCTAATVGATLGLILGADKIPHRWIEPIGEGVYVGPGIIGIQAPTTISELTQRTINLIGKLPAHPWDHRATWDISPQHPTLDALPGSIQLTPHQSIQTVTWANGELPVSVKQSSGATWKWELTTDEPRFIICLARKGAKLFVDNQLVVECPEGLPYVPATHRCPPQARAHVRFGKGVHEVRLELNNSDTVQDVSVILAYPNLHTCPWTAEELPNPATLPPT